MKKIAIISLLLLVCPLIRATEYTVDKVPNVHLDDGRRFVSNPDGILSAETVNTLDQMLFSLQEANTSEVAVVALQSIGDDDIDDFATELFTRWGIGKQNDNGLLVLLILDQRRITFRTGYGIEGILPDAICKRIQTQYVIPQFKQGDYDKGILDGMNVITRILTTPEAVKELAAAPVKKRNRLGENHRYIPHGFPRRISHFVICYALEHRSLCKKRRLRAIQTAGRISPVSLSRQLFVPILRTSPLRRARTTVEASSQQASQL